MSVMRKKERLLAATAVCVGLAVSFLLVEIVVRFLPVTDTNATLPVTPEDPIARFPSSRDFTYSEGPGLRRSVRVRSNNYGFRSGFDYVEKDPRPLVAVIGDSMVEAPMTPFEDTLFACLARGVEKQARVYGFARSGAPFSQYLVYAEFAKRTFRPAKMVFVIVDNDYAGSHRAYAAYRGYHYFEDGPGGALSLALWEYRPDWRKELLKRSRFLNYLSTNVQLEKRIGSLFSGAKRDSAARLAADADPERLRRSKRAVDAFFTLLPEKSGLSAADAVFVLDGIRPELYTKEGLLAAKSSFHAAMHGYFGRRARTLGYPVIDLQPLFVAEHARDGKRFEYPDDGHWNPHGHAVACRAVLDSPLLRGYR